LSDPENRKSNTEEGRSGKVALRMKIGGNGRNLGHVNDELAEPGVNSGLLLQSTGHGFA